MTRAVCVASDLVDDVQLPNHHATRVSPRETHKLRTWGEFHVVHHVCRCRLETGLTVTVYPNSFPGPFIDRLNSIVPCPQSVLIGEFPPKKASF